MIVDADGGVVDKEDNKNKLYYTIKLFLFTRTACAFDFRLLHLPFDLCAQPFHGHGVESVAEGHVGDEKGVEHVSRVSFLNDPVPLRDGGDEGGGSSGLEGVEGVEEGGAAGALLVDQADCLGVPKTLLFAEVRVQAHPHCLLPPLRQLRLDCVRHEEGNDLWVAIASRAHEGSPIPLWREGMKETREGNHIILGLGIGTMGNQVLGDVGATINSRAVQRCPQALGEDVRSAQTQSLTQIEEGRETRGERIM